MPVAGGPSVQVTTIGGFVAEESHDDHALFVARTQGGPGIWRVPIEGGEPVLMAEGLTAENFAVGRTAIYYLAGTSHGRRDTRGTTADHRHDG